MPRRPAALAGERSVKPSRARSARSNQARRSRRVFLNVPFDDIAGYEDCFLAFIAGLVGLGLEPRSVVEIPSGGPDRLTRIFGLMRGCRYSIHDLSRVQLRGGRYPRFNMPFELGLGTALSLTRRPTHDRYVFATRYRLVQAVASDLGGVDVYEHRGTPRGVIVALTNAFVRRHQAADVSGLIQLHRRLRRWADLYFRDTQPRRSVYEPAVFKRLVVSATALVGVGRLGSFTRPAARSRD